MAVNQQAETKLLDAFVNQLLQALVISVVYVFETFLNFVEIQQTVIYVVIVGGNSVYHASPAPATPSHRQVFLRMVEKHGRVYFDFVAVDIDKRPVDVHRYHRNSGI